MSITSLVFTIMKILHLLLYFMRAVQINHREHLIDGNTWEHMTKWTGHSTQDQKVWVSISNAGYD